MERSLILLEDGTELFSGQQEGNAVFRVKLTQKVNEEKDLMPGAVWPSMLEAEFLTPGGTLHIPVGSELTLYKVNDADERKLIGLFTVDEAVRSSPNRYHITAYDRLSRLDKDLTQWVDNLDGWPYSLQTFAQMVCSACNLQLLPEYFTNGEWPVHQFTVVNVTGRKLMQWVGELSCRFCRATPTGEISLDWYTQVDAPVFGKDEFIFMDSFSCADYLTAAIDKVIIRADNKERGYTYGTGSNAYLITGNRLMAVVPNASFEGLARVIYANLHQIRYNPCTLTVPIDTQIQCGDILSFRDGNGKQILMYVMTKIQSDQKNILECTGGSRRKNRM